MLLVAADVNAIGGIQQYNRNVRDGLVESGATLRLVELTRPGLLAKAGFALRIAWRVATFRPDLVWCGHLNFSPVIYLLKRISGVRYVLPLYGIDAIAIRRFLTGSAVRAADLLTPISHYTAAHLLRQYPDAGGRVFLIPNSVDGGRFRIQPKPPYLLERHGLDGRKVVLTVARFNVAEHKGYERVIDALPLVLRESPGARYVIVGGGEDPRIREALDRHGLRDEVVFAGAVPREELPDYYNLCDVYAMPSKFEGFAIVFLEALACGRPVVASDGFGCREALFDGELGLTVDPDSRTQIAAAIARLLTSPPAHLADREGLRRRMLQDYDLAAFKRRVGEAARRATSRVDPR
ncbi:MAG TPA: glycosyltransferase family 4 protein [Candidatus Polarisedimenticolaceae bacterium]|nr:glycosyltransferase family 4 protein [Candidatus Polarisedimenticolaceae bacterium]